MDLQHCLHWLHLEPTHLAGCTVERKEGIGSHTVGEENLVVVGAKAAPTVNCNCARSSCVVRSVVRRVESYVWRVAWGVWRVACGVWRVACGMGWVVG
jgi:hypothetical protein